MPAGNWYVTTKKPGVSIWWRTDPTPAYGAGGAWTFTTTAQRVQMLWWPISSQLVADPTNFATRPIWSQDTTAVDNSTSLAFQAISPPLVAQTLTGTVTVSSIYNGTTVAGTSSMGGTASLFVVNSSGTFTQSLCGGMRNSDAAFPGGSGVFPFQFSFGSLGSASINAGDRIVLEGGMYHNGGTLNQQVAWNDNVAGNDANPTIGLLPYRALVAFTNLPTLQANVLANTTFNTDGREPGVAVAVDSARSRIYSFAKNLAVVPVPLSAQRPTNIGWEIERASFMLRATNLRAPNAHNPDERNSSGYVTRQVPLLNTMPSGQDTGGLGGDAVAPEIGTPTPASGTIARTDSISIPITDNVELGQITCWITYASAPDVEVVYDGTAFSALFNDYSSLSGTDTSKTLVVRRDNPGWLDSPTIHLRVSDTSGNEVTGSFSYTVSGYPFMPALSNVSPVNGSSIARTAPVSFDVSDDVALSLVTVHVSYASAPEADVVYTGAAFGPRFDTASSATPITGGSSFVIQPDGNGWRDDPTITIRATDPEGNPLGAVISYTLSGASYPFTPIIQNLVPSDGDVTPDEYVSFDVFSDNDLSACVVLARFPDLVIDAENSISLYEVVWDGTQLGDMYKTYSTSSPITKGRHFSLRRFGGWPVGVTFKTVSVNTEGQAG